MRNIQAKKWPLMVLFSCLILSACIGNQVQNSVDPNIGRDSLDSWLEDDLIPYLLLQFGQHPRFKGQPVLLVDMQSDNVQPRIDDLTGLIRGRIIDALLKKSGLDLAWRPSIRPWQHHQRLEDVSCVDSRKVHYYVGIDCGLTGDKRNLYVKVRALNLAEQKWVTGFGRFWEGKPNKTQLAALKREHPDEYLRGLRPLPFSNHQPDLLAAYLARNLSCLLQQGEADDLVVYVTGPSANTPEFFKTTLDLVGKYLARFREVRVTDDPKQSNVTVVTAIHSIHQDLHQIWVSARHRQGEKYLPGAETEAYVRIDAQKQPQVAGAQRQRPLEPLLPVQHASLQPELISSFDLLTPLNQGFCSSATPWSSGIRRIAPYEHISSGSCLAVEMSLLTPAYVFLVSQDAMGDLTRMFPSDCHSLRNSDALLYAGKLFQLPSLAGQSTSVLELGGSPGMESVYAIAITTPDLAGRFATRLDEIQGLCRPGKKFPNKLITGYIRHSHERIQHWQNYLYRLSTNNPGTIQWREIRFWHEPS
jgi:hypothetical protein